MLSKAENYYMEKIEKWESELRNGRPNKILHLYSDSIDSALSYIPDMHKQKILHSFDTILFHLHAILFNSTFQRNTAQKLIHHARIHNESIFTLKDMKKLNIDQLQAIADKQIAHYRLLATGQGILASKHTGFLMGDFLSILIINLRAVQVLASIYGRPADSPSEIMISLKVFCTGCLPYKQRMEAWVEIMGELEKEQQSFFYNGNDEMVPEKMLQTLLTELIKLSFLQFYKGSHTGAVIGAAGNYHFTRNITEVAHHYYQKSYLLNKREEN
jgi:hypothetical protein